MNKLFALLVVISGSVTMLRAQSPVLDSLINANKANFQYDNAFSGTGWDQLIEKTSKANYVLIGEDHFISEVPVFTQALTQRVKFDNYICEMDPWMMRIFTSKLANTNKAQLDAWITANYNGFSFFQKKNEFELMKALIAQKTNLFGLEQVGLMSTEIIFQYLAETGSAKNRKAYELLRDSSRIINAGFFADQSKPFHMISPGYSKGLENLDKSAMTVDEKELTQALAQSAAIYETGSHRERIKLMQANFMKFYPSMKGKKNLFKFGANHTMKGESYLPVYDIGTTAHVLAQSENVESYHILVVPRAGKQAGFLTGANDIDFNDGLFKSLGVFFEKSSASSWTFIDLTKIRTALGRKEIHVSDVLLEKTIKGYDALVVMPMATPAQAVR